VTCDWSLSNQGHPHHLSLFLFFFFSFSFFSPFVFFLSRNSYKYVGEHAKALELRIRVLALRQAKLGEDHPDTLTSMSNLAIRY
jgi:hypothetical protein